jgi:hypothetical protein
VADETVPQGTPPAPATPAPAPEIPEERLRALVKERWGIDDEPESYKSKRQQEREALDTIPRYQAALTELARRAQAAQPKEPEPKELDEATLRDQARLDPWVAIQYVRQRDQQAYQSEIQDLKRQVYGREFRDLEKAGFGQIEKNWPEAYDKTSELHKEGQRILLQEMSEQERLHPHAALIATERAAGRLGIPPKSRRTSETRSVQDEVAGQRTGSGRSPRVADEPPKLNDRQKKIAKAFGLKEKAYGAARAAMGEGAS